MKLSKAQLAIKLKAILNSAYVGQCGWSGRETIMTFNDAPIGATISCRDLEIGRWWPDLKNHLVEHIAEELSKK